MTSEEDDKPALSEQKSSFAVMSINELEMYISDLKIEIDKVQRLIQKKHEAKNTAQNVFKS